MAKKQPKKIKLTEGLIVEFTNESGRSVARLEARLEEDILSFDLLDSETGANHTGLVTAPSFIGFYDDEQ
jgi:hypothetical protein